MGHGVVGLLLTAIAGYWVLERAVTHKGRMRQVGQVLGALIILVSLVGVACHIWCIAAGACSGSFSYRRSGKAGFCPFKMKGSAESSSETPAAPSQ